MSENCYLGTYWPGVGWPIKVNDQIKFKQPYWEIVSFGHNFSSTMINIKIFFACFGLPNFMAVSVIFLVLMTSIKQSKKQL